MTLITGLSRQREQAVQQRLTARIANGLQSALGSEIRRGMREIGKHYDNHGRIEQAIAEHRERVTSILNRGWRAAFETFGKRILESAEKSHLPVERKDIFGDFDQRINAWIAEFGALKVTEISGTTRDQALSIIKQATDQGIAEGLSQREIGRMIQSQVREQGGVMSVHRSRVIARTETHAASQAANQEAARASGLPMRKEWISAGQAGRTREDHLDADGQMVGLNDSFTVGGEQLRYPGDPLGSAENVINCRCVEGMHVD